MGYPGEGPLGWSPEIVKREAERQDAVKSEKKRKAEDGGEDDTEHATSSAARERLDHAVFASQTFCSRITVDSASVYGGADRPGVKIKHVCNNPECSAKRKKSGNGLYSEARTSKGAVTAKNPFNSVQFLAKAVQSLVEDHKKCLPSYDELI